MNSVIHDWDEASAAQIVANDRKVMSDDGRLLLLEFVLPDQPEPHFGFSLDTEMLVTGAVHATSQLRTAKRAWRGASL
jgi:hypothetical protein